MACLDRQRLGKQRLEAMMIIQIIERGSHGYRTHPAVMMWKKNVDALKLYYNAAIKEWVKRGYQNTMELYHIQEDVIMPTWFGDPEFHKSHQSNLVRKDAKHYRKYFPDVPSDLVYVWPERVA